MFGGPSLVRRGVEIPMTAQEAYVAFNLTDRIGSVGVDGLAERFGGVVSAWENFQDKTSRTGGDVAWRNEFEKAERFGVTILTPVDAGYPEILRKTRGHPLVLYVKGDPAALSKPCVSIVGTRRATEYGRDQAGRLGFELSERGWCVVSGLALGIDAEAHRGALSAGGATVGVIGSALDRFYPEENRSLAREIVTRGGAVVSEFPFGREPDTQTFPQRNHVVAALARGVIAVEAPVKSGTLITTTIAADLGRVVMAVPGRVDSRSSAGCLALLREGATLVRCAADVEEALGDLFGGRSVAPGGASDDREGRMRGESPAYTVEEALVMKQVDAAGVSIDRLVDLTGLDAGKVNALVMTLRVKGRVRFLPGNRVALPRAR